MDSKIGEWDQYSLINELTQGREAAKLLKIQLNAASSSFSHDQAREILDQKIISSYDNALSILNFSISLSSSQDPQMTELMIEYPPSLRGSPWSDQDSDRDVKDPQELEDGTRKRKKFPRWTEKVRVSPGAGLMGPLDDGFSWRKYGQKDILGAKYPRGYYRCAHRHGKGCLATKQVQRSDEDPTIFEITYRGIHTCAQASQSIIFPPPPQPETQEPTTTIRCLNRQTSFMASSSSYDQISSYEKALSMLNFSSSLSSSQDPQMTELMIEYPPSLTGSPWSDQGSDYDVKDPQELEDGSRKRKTFPRWTEKVRVSPGAGLMGPLDDGFSWRKYGQKDILGAKYPRGYYRCAHRHGKGCLATKQVQRSDEDPTIFEITYRGIHTCAQAPQSIIFPPPPQPETQEPTTTIRCLNRQTSFMASSSSYDQISSYEKALSMHNFSSSLSSSQDPQMTELMIEYPPSLRGSPWSDQDSDRDVKDPQELEDGSRKRKKFPRWTEKVRVSPGAGLMGPLDDGFSWRKYGQKDILGAKYPRGYYRCTHRHGKGCLATKQVQRSDEDPTIFEITYRGIHTCAQASQSIIFPPPPQPGTQEPTTTIRCLNRQTSFMASSSSYDQIYDVFISFRREYPLDNFTCHLYAALSRNRISTFIDDELLSRGNDISVALLNTIENSKISIIIFTNNYASSKWCLDELVKIHECHKMNGQIILPVFYHVDPFDVKKQTGSFGDSFIMLENRFKEMPEMVKNWRDVLTEASNLFGWASNEFRCEAQFIDVIVSDILNKLEKITVSTNSNDLVGLRNEQDKKAFKFKSIDLYHSRFLNGMLDLSSTLSCLSRLNLSDCALMAIPRDIGILSSLKELYLGGNNFVSLPTSMKQLSRLEHLELNNCKMLRSLPELPLFLHYLEACNCDCLQYLPEIPPYLEKLDISTHERLSNVAKYSLEKRSYEASPSWKMDCIVNSRMKLNEKANKILADSQLRFQQMAIASLRQPMYGNKLEHILVSKEDKLVSLFDEACDRLDSHASTFWNHKDLKQLHLKLAQVYDLLRHSKYCTSNQNVILTLWLSNLKGLPCDIDNLLDDWEQLEISRLKFNEEVRRTHEWLVQFWNSFDRCVTGQKEDMSAISELNSARSDEYTVFERDLERSIDSVKHVLLLDVNMVQIITILGMSGTGKTVFAQRIYSNEEVKSHFPLRFWFKVGMNLSFLTVVKAIKVRWCEIRGAEKMLSKRLLIVLDNVCDLDEEKLDKFRLLISDMCDSGSCVLVTTHSDHVATAMRTVPALHFSYFTETDSLSDFNCELLPALQAHGHRLGYEKDLRIEAPELAVMADPQRYLESDTDEGPELSPEDDMSHPPSTGMLAVHESKIQLAPSETVELAVQVPRTIATPERNVQKIFRYVNDVTALKIGVHGVGGIGKTAALKNLICYPGIKSLFDMVILVTVSRYWNTRKIQNEVLRQLSLHREDYETDSEVSGRLLQVLNGKKFLLLLDDVWEQIDLEAMGIPVPSAENGCKILTASRKLDVCHNMNASKVIELESLSWKEAWQLFYEQVGGIVQSPAIRPFARAVVKGCHGLPLLIIVTGKALVEENNDSMWEHASKTFSPPCTATVYQTEDVVQLLKFSFDQLKDGDVKSCFLYYALFSDQEVTISGLIEDCIQEGIISGTHADAHKRGCDIIDVLVKAYLVQVTKDNDTIKMHGLIRDLALGIISSAAEDDAQFLLRAYSRLVEPPRTRSSSSSSSLESPESGRLFIPEAHQFLLGAHAGLTEPPSEEEWICAKMIFLMDNELYTLPNRLSCPNLLMLFLQRNCRLRVIPPSFFELMTSLKVLNLSKTRIKSLPKTLVYLKCLEVLILRDCELLLELPSEVGSLNCLEVLDLEGTEINKLPDEVGKLASLRYLNAFFYGSIDKSANITLPCNLISSGTLSGLQALETLSIVVYPGDKRWNKDVKDVITEVSKLTKLSSLRFYFPKIEYVAEFLKGSVAWKDQHLTEFKFVVGHDVKSIVSRVADYVQFDYNQQDRCLRFVNGKSISTEVLQILARSTAFYVDHHLGIDSLSNFGVCNMNGLKFCVVSECPKIKTVVDIKEHTTTAVFPGLENLTVNYLWNLTRLWEGIVPEGSFVELRSLSVLACQQLKYVFTSSMIQSLSKLEELTVEHCPAVKSIILDGEIIDSGCIMLPGLKKLRLHYLPELVNVWSNDWPSLEYISFYGCPKLKKIGMDSKLKDTLIWIKAEKKWWAELDWKDAELPIHLEDRLSIFSEDSEDQEPSFCS